MRYNHACDYPENSDYGLVVEELRACTDISGKRILEIGPGPGNLCLELLQGGAGQVIGAEPSVEMIQHARQRFQNEIVMGKMDFVQESVYALPVRFDGSFDLVVCHNTFHQLYDPPRALAEMVRVTKSGGEVHLFDFRRDISLELLASRIAYTKPTIWRDLANSICAALTKGEISAMLDQIPGIRYSVTDAKPPIELSDRARALIAADPIPHHLDYRISQKVVIRKGDP